MKELEFQKENEERMLISVIMPVYNSEKYLSNAIGSVLQQTYANFELLLIDDGSKDNSSLICDEFKMHDHRVRVFHQKNGGVCCARNLGIRESRGEYIAFIDNDDLYMTNFLEVMVKELESHPVDMIRCGRKNMTVAENGDTVWTRVSAWKNTQRFDSTSFLDSYFLLKQTDIISSVWNGLYRRSFIVSESISFNERFRHGNEDVYFNLCCFLTSQNLTIVEEVLYEHFYRYAHSTSLKYHEDQIRHRLETIALEQKLLKGLEGTREYGLCTMSNIRVCFKLLSNTKDRKQRQEGLKLLTQAFPLEGLEKYRLSAYHELTRLEKIELGLIKNHMYGLFFAFQTLKQRWPW